jgi:hypothetical protein
MRDSLGSANPMTRSLLYSWICLAFAIGCQTPSPHARGPYHLSTGTPLAITDAASYPDTLYPLLITGAQPARPLVGLYVSDPASLKLVAESLVFAFAFDHAATPVGIVRFHVSTGNLDTLPNPQNYSANLSALDFSPDGRHMAYVQFPGNDSGFGVVRTVPGESLVAATPSVLVAETDAYTGYAQWQDSTGFEFIIQAESLPPRQFLRFRGRVGTNRITFDTFDLSDTIVNRTKRP